jgi:two-component system response regulator HydG
LPPLRERSEDIPLLVQAFLGEFCQTHAKRLSRVQPAAMAIFMRHPWPGNVRQLRNVIEGAVIMAAAEDTEIGPQHLPAEIRQAVEAMGPVADDVHIRIGTSLHDVERELIRATLLHTDGNRAKTARLLGMSRKTLYRKLAEHGLD